MPQLAGPNMCSRLYSWCSKCRYWRSRYLRCSRSSLLLSVADFSNRLSLLANSPLLSIKSYSIILHLQESEIIFSISRIEPTRRPSTIKARSLSIPSRPSGILFFNFCSAQNSANRNSVAVSKQSATFSWSIYQLRRQWGRLSWPDKPRVHVQIDRSSILNGDFGLRGGIGAHTILNQLLCSAVCVRICLFPQIRGWLIIFCSKKIKRSPWHLSRIILYYPLNYPISKINYCFISSIIFSLSLFISIILESKIFFTILSLCYLILSRTIHVIYPLHRHVADKMG